MDSPSALVTQLLLHGGVVLLVGNLCGIPFARAIARRSREARVRSWRVAHSGLVGGGVSMIAVAAALPALPYVPAVSWTLVLSLVASGYGFALALTYGAWRGYRGILGRGPFGNRLVYLGNVVGAAGALIGSIAFLVLCGRSLAG